MNVKQLAVVLVLVSTSASALTYEQALDKAVGYDKKYAAAIATQKASEYTSTIARADLLAKVSVSGFQAGNRLNQRGLDYYGQPSTLTSNYQSQSLTTQLTQPLINLAAIAGYISANKQEEAAQAKLAVAFNDLAINVANQYAALGSAKEVLVYSQKELEVLERQGKMATARAGAGVASKTDLEEVIYTKAQAQVNVDEATNAVEQARIALEKLIGERIAPREAIALIVSPKIHKTHIDELVARAISDNPKIQYQKSTYESTVYENKKALAKYAPTVDLVAAQSYQNSNTLSTVNQKSLQTYGGIQLTIPIFEGGATYGRERQTAYQAESQRLIVESEINDLKEVVQKDYEQMIMSDRKYRALAEQIRSADFLYNSMDKQKELGLKSTYDLMISIRRQYQSAREAAKTKYDAAVSAKRLEINTGGLYQ